jgi:Acyl-CoA reductase (LuxC)
MNLQQRINLLVQMQEYMLSSAPAWEQAKSQAFSENPWFIPQFLQIAVNHIASEFLDINKLEAWTKAYALPPVNPNARNIGLVMAGNIPLVGFHDFLAIFISGHNQTIKPSSKDKTLIQHLVEKLYAFDPQTKDLIQFADMLQDCDAYIATGSNNSARYFDYYFGKYPHIIRRNRTSVAVLTGEETAKDLSQLADDVYLYFGLGCRNVTKIFVPLGFDFVPLLEAFSTYNYLADQHKYKNNYDYQLTLLILNKKYYLTNGSILLSEDPGLFSPISVLHFEYYSNSSGLTESLVADARIQSVSGKQYLPFGLAQKPGLQDYADGIDTLRFLRDLN